MVVPGRRGIHLTATPSRTLYEIGVAERKLSDRYASEFARYRTAYAEHSKQEGRSLALQMVYRFRSPPIRLYEHLLATMPKPHIAALDALTATPGAGLEDWRLRYQLVMFERQFVSALTALHNELAREPLDLDMDGRSDPGAARSHLRLASHNPPAKKERP